ncbi:sensor histidine kinase KdpD [Erythrobacter sp. JK5]|uniref:sensor histidine kinase n=1 Tax=Erythrobacter sp. JK5 TaxID=2829500 RepID=UPI001BAABF38|nr:HAMP domain-containing sensor histidine kinase [Erythrobacter sp. JK5]QUL38648.1 HAMP domain-containing histidine kinase [Erythrobacter sp. JK5]
MALEPNQTLLAARGLTDDRDRLLTADEPLADLHERCGGRIPGTLAVPELLDLVRQGREMGLRIAREFTAFDGDGMVSGFVRVHPLGTEAGGGCELLVENWQRGPQSPENARDFAERLDAIDRATAEIVARLDARQRVQVLNATAPDARALQEAFQEEPGKFWSDYIELVGIAYRQPLHWRLIDGSRCRIPGSDRQWRLRLMPLGPVNGGPRGFEMLLIAEEPLTPSDADGADSPEDERADARMIGSALTPVLRQPIARIVANAETIRSRLAGPLKPEYSEYAGNIATAGKHLSAMLDDLADLEVVEAAGFTTIAEKVDLGDAARRAAGILGVRAQDRSIVLDIVGEADGIVAVAEFRRVLQILINLIGNAIAYSPEDSTVTIAAKRAANGRVEVSVSDEGPGVEAGQVEQVFEKFERLGRDNDGGSGLGLYISRRLARAMDGDLTLASQSGAGRNSPCRCPRPGSRGQGRGPSRVAAQTSIAPIAAVIAP